MIEWVVIGTITLANAAAAGLAWWFCSLAAYHKRLAQGSAAYSREARTDGGHEDPTGDWVPNRFADGGTFGEGKTQ